MPSRTVGLTVCPGAFCEERRARAVRELALAVKIWWRYEYGVRFLVFQRPASVPDDGRMFGEICDVLGLRVKTRVVHGAPAVTLGVDLVCGMRFHGLVLAALAGKPFVGLAHDDKVRQICVKFNMPCAEAAAFDGKTLGSMVATGFARAVEPATTRESIERAGENFRLLARCLG